MGKVIKRWQDQYLLEHGAKYTLKELSAHLQLPTSTIYKHLRSRKMRAYKEVFRIGTVELPPVDEYKELFPCKENTSSMIRTPTFHLVFFPLNGEALRKVVTKEEYTALAQNDVLTEINIANSNYVITGRKRFNRIDSSNTDFFLIMDIIIKPEVK